MNFLDLKKNILLNPSQFLNFTAENDSKKIFLSGLGWTRLPDLNRKYNLICHYPFFTSSLFFFCSKGCKFLTPK